MCVCVLQNHLIGLLGVPLLLVPLLLIALLGVSLRLLIPLLWISLIVLLTTIIPLVPVIALVLIVVMMAEAAEQKQLQCCRCLVTPVKLLRMTYHPPKAASGMAGAATQLADAKGPNNLPSGQYARPCVVGQASAFSLRRIVRLLLYNARGRTWRNLGLRS